MVESMYLINVYSFLFGAFLDVVSINDVQEKNM